MKFKIDENLPVEVAGLFQQHGFDAMTVLDQALGGEPDDKISLICQKEERIIVTLDLDFADIRTYPPSQFAGIIVLRLKRLDKFSVISSISNLIQYLQKETISKQLLIVSEKLIRIRE